MERVEIFMCRSGWIDDNELECKALYESAIININSCNIFSVSRLPQSSRNSKNYKTRRFGNNLFSSSGEGETSILRVPYKELTLITGPPSSHPVTEADPVSETLCFWDFRISAIGQRQNTVIRSVIYRRQNPLESKSVTEFTYIPPFGTYRLETPEEVACRLGLQKYIILNGEGGGAGRTDPRHLQFLNYFLKFCI
jgi:hypothetical protein